MAINADVSVRVALDTGSMAWQVADGSGTAGSGMACKLLDADEGEARVTCMVQCAPGGVLDSLAPELGEEILVLDGVLADDAGAYAAGVYLRNPPGVARTLRSAAPSRRRGRFSAHAGSNSPTTP